MKGLDHFIKMTAYERGINLNSLQIYAIKQVLIHTDMWNKAFSFCLKLIKLICIYVLTYGNDYFLSVLEIFEEKFDAEINNVEFTIITFDF